MTSRPRALVLSAVVFAAFALSSLALAAPALAEIDVAGWHFQDLSSHHVPITFAAAFDSEKLAWVKYDGQQSDIYLLDFATGNETRVTDTPERESAVAMDGNRLVWVSREGDDFSKPALGRQYCQDCHMLRTPRKTADDGSSVH